jgi:hypothetical protein
MAPKGSEILPTCQSFTANLIRAQIAPVVKELRRIVQEDWSVQEAEKDRDEGI